MAGYDPSPLEAIRIVVKFWGVVLGVFSVLLAPGVGLAATVGVWVIPVYATLLAILVAALITRVERATAKQFSMAY